MTFEFTAGDLDCDGEEDDYTAEQILTDKPDPATPGGRLCKVRWKGFAASRDSWEPPSSYLPMYTTVWLDYRKKKGISLEVKNVLVHLIMNERDWDASSLTLHTIVCFCLICRRDADTMAQYLPSTPDPNFLDMRRAYGTKISLRLCSYFFCVDNRLPLAQEIPTDQESSRPLHISFFFGVAFGKCIGESDTPAMWDRSWTCGLELQSLQGI